MSFGCLLATQDWLSGPRESTLSIYYGQIPLPVVQLIHVQPLHVPAPPGCGLRCDHWHDGAGFVTSHIALTLLFEQSLQAINPSIAVPYWDFTIEGTFYEGPFFRESGVFASDWFGTARPKNVRRL